MPETPGGGELRWGLVLQRTVRTLLVVIGTPRRDDVASLGQRSEAVLVQALVAKLGVETFDISLLRGFARLHQPQLNAVLVSRSAPASGALSREAGAIAVLIPFYNEAVTVDLT